MSDATNIVNFYRVSDEFGEFSNFARYPFTLDGEQWQTSEHYFQAQKFHNKTYREKIRNAKTAMLAANLGNDRTQKLRSDWESVKVGLMEKIETSKEPRL